MKSYIKISYIIASLLGVNFSANAQVADYLNDAEGVRIVVEYNKKYIRFNLASYRTIEELKRKIQQETGIKPWLQNLEGDTGFKTPSGLYMQPYLIDHLKKIELKDYQTIAHLKNTHAYHSGAPSMARGSGPSDPHLGFKLSLVNIVDPQTQKLRPVQSKEDELLAIDQQLRAYRNELSNLDEDKEKVRALATRLEYDYASLERDLGTPPAQNIGSGMDTPATVTPPVPSME